ncbi:UNVERIFIED_CONTAM: hypothetical protein Slati_0665400 [Sesamum latifolium]|uniref:Uncharacterized protein n=1 Tax=Sesamum latifolium TaxID=2727402 RepID=A0AAW2Y3P8_9LAMI
MDNWNCIYSSETACTYACRYMKLRLDRVLQESFEADSLEEALASNPVNLEFEKPEKWTAPYPKYEYGWWEPFLLSKTSKEYNFSLATGDN